MNPSTPSGRLQALGIVLEGLRRGPSYGRWWQGMFIAVVLLLVGIVLIVGAAELFWSLF